MCLKKISHIWCRNYTASLKKKKKNKNKKQTNINYKVGMINIDMCGC